MTLLACRFVGSWVQAVWMSGETEKESLTAFVWGEFRNIRTLGAHDFCRRVFISSLEGFNKYDITGSVVFVSLQVYVEVNKHAEHDEDLKQAARDFFRQLEQHESNAVSLWKQFRDITVDEYQHVYKVRPAACSKTYCHTAVLQWQEGIVYPNKYNQLLWSVTVKNLTFVLCLLAVRGPLWCLLRGVPSPSSSPGGGAAAAEPRTVENLRVGDGMCDGL